MALHIAFCCHTTLPPLRHIPGPINHTRSWRNRSGVSPRAARFSSKSSSLRYESRHNSLPATVCNARRETVGEHPNDSKAPAGTQLSVTESRQGEVANIESDPDPHWDWAEGPGSKIAFALLAASVPVVPLLPRLSWSAPLYFLAAALWATVVGSNRSLNMRQYQSLSFEQSFAVPVLCSVSLFGFYSLLKFFPDLDLRSVLSGYLSITGVLAISSNLSQPLEFWLPSLKTASKQLDIPAWLLSDDGRPVHVTLTSTHVLATLVGVVTVVASKQAGAPFTLTNVVALCIVTELLQLISLGSFKTSAAMLGGLLLYDVFWVFGSSPVFGDNVMLTVATSAAFDGPMKLIYPHWNLQSGNPYSILGLGDVAAPGLLIALMLRFDRYRGQQGQGEGTSRTYFNAALVSYIAGLVFTIGINAATGAAQPALLYLVPALLGGISLTAVSRSEWGLLWKFKEERSQPLPTGEAYDSDKKQ